MTDGIIERRKKMPSITSNFIKEIEMYKKANDIYGSKNVMWLASRDHEIDNRINISIVWNLPEMIDYGLTLRIDDRDIKDDLDWYKLKLENNYLISHYPNYDPNSDEDEYEGEDKFPIPKNVKSDIYWETEYKFYVFYAEKLIKKIRLYMCMPNNVNINVYSSINNNLLVSEEGDDNELTEWDKEYTSLCRRFGILDAKLSIPVHKAVETYDCLTQDDLKVLDKLYYSHEINRILLYGKYYVLLNNIITGLIDSDGKLNDDVTFEKRDEKKCLTEKMSNGIHTVSWDDDETHKIEESYKQSEEAQNESESHKC